MKIIIIKNVGTKKKNSSDAINCFQTPVVGLNACVHHTQIKPNPFVNNIYF